ncbi:histone-lysine N-methyltransferase SMYD3-like [Paramacrobiotus metropolitanus]|uniref:histone-lysine N-methyltransferase SMYD3-like n=1 Tax=Paramacrobiotus metropolitanus TaxID=2943436 RepID=UPI002445BC90|nr:histone-lysine N-methyltransferase SMYD3-like [Paramacrobiotus metropolitanus]
METKETVSTTGSRSFKPGDVVMCCEPLVWVLDSNTYKTRCAHCLHASQELRTCSGCKLHRYCSVECQSTDWKLEHKLECALLKNATGAKWETAPGSTNSTAQQVLKIPRELVAKLANKIKLNLTIDVPGLGRKSVKELWEMLPSHPKLGQENTTRQIAAIEDPPLGITLPEMVEYYVNIQHNAMPIMDAAKGKGHIGMAVYPPASPRLMTPVCWDKNVVLNFRGRRLVIHAVEEIPNYTGLKDLRFDYIREPYHQTRAERRAVFEKFYGYPCTCRKCTRQYEADINPLKCITAGCANRIPSDNRALQPCTDCGALNYERLMAYVQFMVQHEVTKARCPEEYLPAVLLELCKELDAAGILHPDAHIRYICGWEWPRKLYNENRFEDGWKMMQEMIVFVRNIYPKYEHFRAVVLVIAGVSTATALKKRVMEQIGQLSAAETKDLKTLSDQAFSVILDYCSEANEIFTLLFGDGSREAIKGITIVALTNVMARDIEKAFSERK